MDILRYIENLKEKPEHVRKRYAFSVSFVISFMILAGWLASYGIGSSPVLTEKDSNGDAVVESPVSSLTASVVGAFNDVKKMFSGLNKVEYNSENGMNGIEVKAGSR